MKISFLRFALKLMKLECRKLSKTLFEIIKSIHTFVSVRVDIRVIEIIRAARSIIPATELTFLSLHMHLYSKICTYTQRFIPHRQLDTKWLTSGGKI